jgi:hypothetical protein
MEDLRDCQKGSDKNSYFRVGNEMILVEDIINPQERKRGILDCQVGKGFRMRLSESIRSSEVSSDQEGVLIDEDSCGFFGHVNEDDEKLNTSTIKEEDQRCIMIIAGIKLFLPTIQAEASTCVASAAIEGKPTESVKKEEEKEKKLMFSPAEGEENSAELLKIFSLEVEQELTAALEFAAEGEAYSMDFSEMYEELESLERRVILQR